MIRISDAGDGVGIPFRLLGHVTTASIRDSEGGFVSIFEEHAVVPSLKDYRPASQVEIWRGMVWGEWRGSHTMSILVLELESGDV